MGSPYTPKFIPHYIPLNYPHFYILSTPFSFIYLYFIYIRPSLSNKSSLSSAVPLPANQRPLLSSVYGNYFLRATFIVQSQSRFSLSLYASNFLGTMKARTCSQRAEYVRLLTALLSKRTPRQRVAGPSIASISE